MFVPSKLAARVVSCDDSLRKPPMPDPRASMVELSYEQSQHRDFEKLHWVMDNLNTHCSRDLCQMVAYLRRWFRS